MYQLNPLFEGNGQLSTAMNLARKRVVNGGNQWSANIIKDPNASKFRKITSWFGNKVNKINNSKFFHNNDRSIAANKLKEIRAKQGSNAGRAYRDFMVAKANNKTFDNTLGKKIV